MFILNLEMIIMMIKLGRKQLEFVGCFLNCTVFLLILIRMVKCTIKLLDKVDKENCLYHSRFSEIATNKLFFYPHGNLPYKPR